MTTPPGGTTQAPAATATQRLASRRAAGWLPRRWMWLAAAAGLLAAAGSVVGLASPTVIYGQETADLADAAAAQDLVSLLVAAPLIVVLGWRAHRGHLRAYFGWLGCLGFTVYNYAMYAFSIHFGPLFLVWVGVLGLSVFALLGSLASVDATAIKACFGGQPLRWPGWFLIVTAALFALLWLSEILPDLAAQRPSHSASQWNVPANPVHVLDLAVFLPAAVTTGVLLLRRHRWGRHGRSSAHLGGLDLSTDPGHPVCCRRPRSPARLGRRRSHRSDAPRYGRNVGMGAASNPARGSSTKAAPDERGVMATDRVDGRVEESSRPRSLALPPGIPRRALLAAAAGLSVTGLLALVGPRPVGPAPGRSGDLALLVRAEPHLRGLNRVALASLDRDTTRYAGIGADERTPFGIGSVSKTFCGGVLMDMVAKEEVTLDTTVSDICAADRSELASVTLRELASHTSGLPDFTATETSRRNLWFGLLHADGARQNATDTVTDILGQHLEARGTFSYSTAGIALLAHLLARRVGITYTELLNQRILSPLALTGTSLPVTRAGLPLGWEKGLLGGRPAEPWTLDGLAPGGGMWSTCADLATWVRLTRDGRQPGAAGLAPVAPAPIPPYLPDARVAITWILSTTPAGEDLIFHNGLTGSHHCFVGYCPRTGRGLAYLVNSVPTGAQLKMLQGDLVKTLLDERV